MQPDLEAEFDAGLARAGLSVAPERRAAMLEGFRAYRLLAAELAEPLPHAVEPLALFRPEPRR